MRARWALALATAHDRVHAAAAASATDPVDLGQGYVLDDVGVLSGGEEAEAQTRLEQLASDTDLDLWVVYVDEFTNPSNSEEGEHSRAERPRPHAVPARGGHGRAPVLPVGRLHRSGFRRTTWPRSSSS